MPPRKLDRRFDRTVVFTELGRMFIDKTLAREYEDDQGGQRPAERAHLVDLMQRIWDGRLTDALAHSYLEQLLMALLGPVSVLTFEDVVVISNLARLYAHDPESRLGVAASFGKWVLTHGILQSKIVREKRYHLYDPPPSLFPRP